MYNSIYIYIIVYKILGYKSRFICIYNRKYNTIYNSRYHNRYNS